ncbi:hypothetical protein NQ317_010588 [Molorchus minor]|uniref:CCHC-type domain-containing protein n=1 Tax=Molorchus minor TaxID=1323400 RepID=A0ABQ9IQF0_9CUCU|nr:hypothetical protein NQ317_010588 [Molorchus minor]
MPNMDLTNQPPAPQANIVFTNEQFNELLSRLTIAQHSEPTTQRKTGHFTNCSSRFNGSKDSDMKMHLKDFQCCLTVLPLHGTKVLKVPSPRGQKPLTFYELFFGPRKPPYRVYRELFESEQDRNTASDIFICKARSILAQLPTDTLTEATQIDMVYGLLHRRIREKVTRDSVTTFTELLQKCRLVEETFEVNTRPPIEQKDNKRPRCQYCKYIGHTKDECRKLSAKSEEKPKHEISTYGQGSEQPTTSSSTSKPIEDTANAKPPIQCYKCGKPGYIRSKCPKCNGTETATLDFLSLDTLIAPRSRPIFEVSILGYHGAGLIDTAAKQSVAGSMLYDIFKKENQRFEEEQIIVKLADGNAKEEMVLVTHQDVILQGRSIATKFIIFPEATNFTLFGIDFLQDAQVILNLGENSWNFSDSPESKFPLNYELPLPCNKPVEFASLENLRPEEGTMLDEIQKKKLATLLEENEDIFQPGGEPTPWQDARSINERQQDRQKVYADAHKREVAPFAVGDRVWVNTHTLSSADKGITTKFHPKRDGPYEILRVVSPVSFQVCNPTESNIPLGIYHMSALTPVEGQVNEKPVVEIKRRGRPPKKKTLPSNNNGPSSGRVQDHGGSV